MSAKQHVMIPLDFTPLSLEAVRVARDLIFDSTEVTLLYIYDPSESINSASVDITPRQERLPVEIAERLQRRLQRIRDRELGDIERVNFEIAVSRFPAEAICKHIRQESVDLVILTTHGRSGLSRLLKGSVAESVVRGAACPVLVVRPRDTEAGGKPERGAGVADPR